jgi:hypothetical protein
VQLAVTVVREAQAAALEIIFLVVVPQVQQVKVMLVAHQEVGQAAAVEQALLVLRVPLVIQVDKVVTVYHLQLLELQQQEQAEVVLVEVHQAQLFQLEAQVVVVQVELTALVLRRER